MLWQNILILFLNLVFVTTFSIGTTNTRDIVCSKYDFEEKVLEKLVRFEHRIELYEEKLKSWEANIESKMDKNDKAEFKREQDFKELKATVNSETERQSIIVYDLVSNVTSEASVLFQTLKRKLDLQTTAILENITTQLAKVDGIEIEMNSRISKLVEKVAVTSCISNSGTKSRGEIFKFDDVKTEIGINQISSFKTNGKFTCEKDGLYQVSVYIATHTKGGTYSIYKNGNSVSQIYANNNPGTFLQTGTGVVAVVLQVGDTVWVQNDNSMHVYGNTWSCITIVKIK